MWDKEYLSDLREKRVHRLHLASSHALFTAFQLECVPESQRLVPCSCDDRLPIWTHREIQDSESVAREGGDLGHGWVFPDVNLVLSARSWGVAVGGDQLVGIA